MPSRSSQLPFGFRIVGGCQNERRLIDWQAAFVAYSQCDDRAEVGKEAYLSAFNFGPDFRQLLESTGSTAGWNCCAIWKFSAEAMVGGVKVAEATISALIADE